jgi:hypothetical protein
MLEVDMLADKEVTSFEIDGQLENTKNDTESVLEYSHDDILKLIQIPFKINEKLDYIDDYLLNNIPEDKNYFNLMRHTIISYKSMLFILKNELFTYENTERFYAMLNTYCNLSFYNGNLNIQK